MGTLATQRHKSLAFSMVSVVRDVSHVLWEGWWMRGKFHKSSGTRLANQNAFTCRWGNYLALIAWYSIASQRDSRPAIVTHGFWDVPTRWCQWSDSTGWQVSNEISLASQGFSCETVYTRSTRRCCVNGSQVDPGLLLRHVQAPMPSNM